MLDIVDKINAEEKKSEHEISEAEKQARIIINNAQKKADDILSSATILSKKEKKHIIEEMSRDTIRQVRQIEKEKRLRLSQIKAGEAEKQKAINFIIKNIFND